MRSIERPVFIAGPARSGTSLLFSTLSKARPLWSSYRELHGLYEWDAGLAPDFTEHENGTSGRDDNVLTEVHATATRKRQITNRLFRISTNGELFGTAHSAGPMRNFVRTLSRGWKRIQSPIQFIGKNPKHCFRVRFLKELFPDATFVFLYRSPEANISSLIEGWKSGRYATYQVPRAGDSFQWHFDLPPDWDEWMGMDLPERCAHQWVGYNRALLKAEDELSEDDFIRCRYEEMVDHPLQVAQSILEFLGLEVDSSVRAHCTSLPVVNSVTAPDPDKWRKREAEIRRVAPIFSDMAEKIDAVKTKS